MAAAHPLFVVGASRSGTTMLARMLGRDPDVAYLRESQFFNDLYPVQQLGNTVSARTALDLAWQVVARAAVEPVNRRQCRADLQSLLPASNLTAADAYAKAMGWLAARSGKRTYVEHTPRNVYYLDELRRHYPEAFFIGLVRDPRAVIASQKHRWRQRSLGAHKISAWETLLLRANYHPYTACRLWNKAAQCLLAPRDTSSFALLRYEDLIADPAASLGPVLARAGYVFSPAMQEVPLWGSSHLPHAATSGLSSESLEKWRDVLSPNEQQLVIARCCERMTDLGYTVDDEQRSTTSMGHTLTYPLNCLAIAALNPRRAWIQMRSLTAKKS